MRITHCGRSQFCYSEYFGEISNLPYTVNLFDQIVGGMLKGQICTHSNFGVLHGKITLKMEKLIHFTRKI